MNAVHLAPNEKRPRKRRYQISFGNLLLLPVFFAAWFTLIRWFGDCPGIVAGSLSLVVAMAARRRRVESLTVLMLVLLLVFLGLSKFVASRIQIGGISGF